MKIIYDLNEKFNKEAEIIKKNHIETLMIRNLITEIKTHFCSCVQCIAYMLYIAENSHEYDTTQNCKLKVLKLFKFFS